MTRPLLLFLLALPAAQAQESEVARGARLFRTRCAVAYCHGPNGTAGKAPKLIGHTRSSLELFRVVTSGIPGTGMPGFVRQMKTDDIDAVVSYVMTLAGAPTAGAAAGARQSPPMPPAAKVGRALFFDAARIAACGACHELDGWGAAIGPNLAALKPEQFSDLRGVRQSHVMTAHPEGGEAGFPALVVEQSQQTVRVYDLSARLPVLRTFRARQVTLSPAGDWRHQDVARIYTDEELGNIALFLRWLSQTSAPR